jgi:hypothetical protein
VRLGKKHWAIAEGYIPEYSTIAGRRSEAAPGDTEEQGSSRELTSHETACLLNTTDREAHVAITIYYSDRDPTGPYLVTVAPRRTLHLRFNDLSDPAPIPRGTDFSSVIASDVPIVVQHTRLDSRTQDISLMTTSAYSQ